ncbi:MAG: PilZ domain-containing protein [Candidatus Omnitrophica bacterium]|nr:PilZ domain-containing protein [Candidatus Omnitrophota bacterium]
MDKDRRTHQRLTGIANVRYAVRDRDSRMLESLPRNICGGGVGLCLPEKLASGTILELEITIPDNPEKGISGVGEVLWSRPFGVIESEESVCLHETGIKFINVDQIGIGRVYSYFRQNQSVLK